MNYIDYVVPMVFPQDREWRKNFTAVGCSYSDHDRDSVRYRSWELEGLLIQCVRKFMPWVRTIHIILAQKSQERYLEELEQPLSCEALCASFGEINLSPSQASPYSAMPPEGENLKHGTLKPETNGQSPRIHIVYHEDIMPKKFLPTFNSRAIEMYLHRIPGLSDYFIYGNDDMFPLSPLKESDFFRPCDGIAGHMLPCQHMNEKPLPDKLNNFQQACLAGLNFVAEPFGHHYTNTLLRSGHTVAPICKSSCLALWERGAKEIEGSVTRFRLAQNFNQYIYAWYQHFTGQYIDHQPPHPMAGVKVGLQQTIDTIRQKDCGIVCINDHESCSNYRQWAVAVKREITLKLKNAIEPNIVPSSLEHY